MASVRYVAIEVGAGHPGRVRPVVTRAAIIAGTVSVVLGALTFALAGPIGRALRVRHPRAVGCGDPRGRARDPVRGPDLHVAGRQPRAQGDAAHALRAVGRAAAAVDRADARALAGVRQDRGDGRLGLRGLLDHRGARRLVLLGNDQPPLHAGGARPGAHRQDRALRRPARDRRAVVAGPVLDRLLRRVGDGVGRICHIQRGRRVLGVRAGGA